MASKYYLGIEGGGTKTRGLLADAEGLQIKTTLGSSTNYSAVSEEGFTEAITNVMDALIKRSDISLINGATFGLAGIGRKSEREKVENILSSLGFKEFTLMTDVELTYRSILGQSQGILLIAGTGSVCMVKSHAGKYQKIGGWGYLLGDEGSGYFIGRNAIRQALKNQEFGIKPTMLTKEIMNRFGVENENDIVSRIYSSGNVQRTISSLSVVVCESAKRGDREAVRIVEDTVGALISLVILGLEVLEGVLPVNLGIAGGLLEEGSPVLSEFMKRAEKIGLRVDYMRQQIQPAAAALIHSFEAADVKVDANLFQKIKEVEF